MRRKPKCQGFYYTGCAVWAFKGWLGDFYPTGSKAGDFLRLYCDRMTAVEGNTTFYSMPNAETIQRWADHHALQLSVLPQAAPRAYSHQGKLVPFVEASHRFLQNPGPPWVQRLGPLFIQLPPGLQPLPYSRICREFSGPVAPPSAAPLPSKSAIWTGSRSPTPTA